MLTPTLCVLSVESEIQSFNVHVANEEVCGIYFRDKDV